MKTPAAIARTGARFAALSSPSSRCLHSSARRRANPEPSEGHQLDPSLQQLLRDTDLSLLKSRRSRGKISSLYDSPKELEVSEASASSSKKQQEKYEEDDLDDERSIEDDIDAWHNRDEKRSVEASFGSKYVGLSSIPEELNDAISSMIGGACIYSFAYIPN